MGASAPLCGYGGIGRRMRLKIAWAVRPVGVQVPLPASNIIIYDGRTMLQTIIYWVSLGLN